MLSFRILFISALVLLFMGSGYASSRDQGDGQIHFFTYYLQENALVRYRDEQGLLQKGFFKIVQLFRSRESGKTHPIDPSLIALIDQIEDHFQVRQVEVISGYRSDQFNHSLKESGHNVANESFHTKGMAADLHLDEISEKALRDYVLSLGQGGVGYYPSLDMVHVDVGPIRRWTEETPRKKWIGEKNNLVPMRLTVSPTQAIGNKILERLTIEGDLSIDQDVTIEFFDRGQWVTSGTIHLRDIKQRSLGLNQFQDVFEKLPWGKFRLKASIQGQPNLYQYSNEFYFKRL